ncbi:MAG: hypothetical protein JW791_00165 [Nanoarchaeota archaeon]|nr:hypothetical protein [Nanoarchaeota archaeon]
MVILLKKNNVKPTSNGNLILCDHPSLMGFSPSEYSEILKSELDNKLRSDEPLIIEVHSYTITCGEMRFAGDESNWDEFKSFLDYAQDLNSNFVTVDELVKSMASACIE